MKTRFLIRDRVLLALADQPLLSARQLALYLALSGRSVRQGLEELKRRGWVQAYNAHQPRLHTRSLFAPTAEGIQALAQATGMRVPEYLQQKGLTSARLERLLLLTERVFQLRTFFLWLSGAPPTSRSAPDQAASTTDASPGEALAGTDSESGWRLAAWDVEVGRFFSASHRAFWIPFHGAAIVAKSGIPSAGVGREPVPASGSRWATIVVEFDLRRVPVEQDRERLVKYVLAQDDPRFVGPDREQLFPVLVVIAQDEFRLQDYYMVLQAAALARQFPMPRAYFTTTAALLSLQDDRMRPIWFSTVSGRQVSFLTDLDGIGGLPPEQAPWRKLPLVAASDSRSNLFVGIRGPGKVKRGVAAENPQAALSIRTDIGQEGKEKEKEIQDPETRPAGDLLQLSLALRPLAKQLLDEIAAHPLLTQPDLALLLRVSGRKARLRLGQLVRCQLVELHRDRYLLAAKGEAYLAMVAGFEHAIRRHARARGWAGGYELLLKHWEHTRAENDFFLHLAAITRAKGHSLRWLSELEGRLYYEAGHRRHSFLPDGRGTYRAGSRRYEFALEVDRSRMAQSKFRRKFVEYLACVESNVLRREGIELLRVLVITSSWERAENLARVAREVAPHLHVFLTTFDRLQASGANAPIWLRTGTPADQNGRGSPKTHCFECFRPLPPTPRARSP